MDDQGNIIDGEYFLKAMNGREKSQKRAAWKLKVKKKARGGFIAVSGYKKSVGTFRRCMHDTVINGAKRLGIDINKKRLDKERPPRKTVDTSFEEIENAPVVQESLRFVPVHGWRKTLSIQE